MQLKFRRYFCALFLSLSFQTAYAGTADSLLTAANAAQNPARRDEMKYAAAVRYYKTGVQDTAILLLSETMKSGSASIAIQSLNALGNLYSDRGDNPRALKYYQQALTDAEHASNPQQIAQTYKNIGALYVSWKRWDDALAYYARAEAEARILKDSAIIADCYNNRGTVYEQQEKLDSAVIVYNAAKAYYAGAGHKAGLAMTLSNLAIVYKRQKNYPASIAANKQSLALSKELGDSWMAAATLNNIGNAYGERGDYAAAIDYCNQSLAIARPIDAKEIISATYESMGEAATRAGDFKAAVDYYKAFTAVKDSFINTESTRQLSELQVKYETAKKDRENEKLVFEARLAERRRMLTLYISIGAVMALAAIFGLAYRARRVKDRLEEERQVAQAMFDSEQRERIRIARDLHDSIGQILAVTKMHVSVLQEEAIGELQERAMTAADLVDKAAAEVRAISHNLIPEELNFGILSAIYALCDKINKAGSIKAAFEVEESMHDYKFGRPFELSLYRIVQEVVTDMLRHSGGSEIAISLSRSGDGLALHLRDNGKGFDVDKMDDSEGLGWKNIAARVRLLNGRMQVQSERISGTRIEIALPAERT